MSDSAQSALLEHMVDDPAMGKIGPAAAFTDVEQLTLSEGSSGKQDAAPEVREIWAAHS